VPIASTKLGARKIAAARSSDVQVGDRAVAGLVSQHGSAPGANCAEPSNASVQDRLVARRSGRHQSAFQDHSERIITLHMADGNRAGQPLARILPHLRPAPRSIASHRCKAPPGHARSGRHTRLASRRIRVFSGVYSWFHLQCVFGVLLGVGRGRQVVMILGPDHEPPVLSQSSGHWLMTPGDDD